MSTEDALDDDRETPETRLAVAKQKVAGLIDQMERGMTAMILSFAGEPRVVQEFTDNTRLLRERLATIRPSHGPTDLRGALELAEGLANPAQVTVQEGAPEVDLVQPESATLFILSDGRFSDVEEFALGNLDPIYLPLGSPDTANLALTALDTRLSEAFLGQRQAFVEVTNHSEQQVEAIVEMRLDGVLFDAQRLAVSAGETNGATFPLGEVKQGALEARLTADTLTAIGDKLKVDDRAFAALNPAREGRIVLITPSNPALEQALATERIARLGGIELRDPLVLDDKTHQRLASAGAFDLVIYDRCAPTEMPRAHTLSIAGTPPAAWREGEDPLPVVVAPQVIDWNRSHPLLANVELGNFDIVESSVLDPPIGGSALIETAEGVIAAVAPRGAFEDVVLGFAILVEEEGRLQRNTDWINRHSFPTFWLNTLEYFVSQSGRLGAKRRPGDPVELKPIASETKELVVVSPDGERSTLRRRGREPFVYQATDSPGVYRVIEAGRESERFAVNLFDRSESDVRLETTTEADNGRSRQAALKIGNIEVQAATNVSPAREELWKPLLVAALVLLIIEWYVYHRRVFI